MRASSGSVAASPASGDRWSRPSRIMLTPSPGCHPIELSDRDYAVVHPWRASSGGRYGWRRCLGQRLAGACKPATGRASPRGGGLGQRTLRRDGAEDPFLVHLAAPVGFELGDSLAVLEQTYARPLLAGAGRLNIGPIVRVMHEQARKVPRIAPDQKRTQALPSRDPGA